MKSRAYVACAVVVCVLFSQNSVQADVVTDTAFVNRVYSDLLSRPADPAGLSAGLNAIATNSVQPWLGSVLGSLEYRTDLVGAFYLTLLLRAPSGGEQLPYVGLLATVTDERVEANIAGSFEYFNTRGGSTNSGFVQAVFQDFLHRSPGGDLVTFLALIGGGATREQVTSVILASSEYHQDLLNSYYERFLGHPVDAGGLAAFLPGMNNATLTDENVIAIILGSSEYYQHAQPVTAVPELSTWVMMILGFCGLGCLTYRRGNFCFHFLSPSGAQDGPPVGPGECRDADGQRDDRQ